MEIIAPGWMESNIIHQMKTFSTAGIVFVLHGGEAGFLHKISQSANIIPFLEWYFNKGKYIALQSFYLNISLNSNVTSVYLRTDTLQMSNFIYLMFIPKRRRYLR